VLRIELVKVEHTQVWRHREVELRKELGLRRKVGVELRKVEMRRGMVGHMRVGVVEPHKVELHMKVVHKVEEQKPHIFRLEELTHS